MTYNVFSGTLNPTHFTSLRPSVLATGLHGQGVCSHLQQFIYINVFIQERTTKLSKRRPTHTAWNAAMAIGDGGIVSA